MKLITAKEAREPSGGDEELLSAAIQQINAHIRRRVRSGCSMALIGLNDSTNKFLGLNSAHRDQLISAFKDSGYRVKEREYRCIEIDWRKESDNS